MDSGFDDGLAELKEELGEMETKLEN